MKVQIRSGLLPAQVCADFPATVGHWPNKSSVDKKKLNKTVDLHVLDFTLLNVLKITKWPVQPLGSVLSPLPGHICCVLRQLHSYGGLLFVPSHWINRPTCTGVGGRGRCADWWLPVSWRFVIGTYSPSPHSTLEQEGGLAHQLWSLGNRHNWVFCSCCLVVEYAYCLCCMVDRGSGPRPRQLCAAKSAAKELGPTTTTTAHVGDWLHLS